MNGTSSPPSGPGWCCGTRAGTGRATQDSRGMEGAVARWNGAGTDRQTGRVGSRSTAAPRETTLTAPLYSGTSTAADELRSIDCGVLQCPRVHSQGEAYFVCHYRRVFPIPSTSKRRRGAAPGGRRPYTTRSLSSTAACRSLSAHRGEGRGTRAPAEPARPRPGFGRRGSHRSIVRAPHLPRGCTPLRSVLGFLRTGSSAR